MPQTKKHTFSTVAWGACHACVTFSFASLALLAIIRPQIGKPDDDNVGITINTGSVASMSRTLSDPIVTEYVLDSYDEAISTMNKAHYRSTTTYELFVASIVTLSSDASLYRMYMLDSDQTEFALLNEISKGEDDGTSESYYNTVGVEMGNYVLIADPNKLRAHYPSEDGQVSAQQFEWAATDDSSTLSNWTVAFDIHYNHETSYQYSNDSVVFVCVAVVRSGGRGSDPEVEQYGVTRVEEMNQSDETYKLMGDLMVNSTVPFLSIHSHDVDKDGYLDVIAGTQGNFYDCEDDCDRAGGVYALYGTADPSITQAVEVRGPSDGTVNDFDGFGYNYVLDMHAGDIDEDGDVDLVVSIKPNSTAYEVHLYLCDGGRSFPSTIVLDTGRANVSESQPRKVRMVDIDNDGLKDVVFASTAATRDETDFAHIWRYEGSSNISLVSQLKSEDAEIKFDTARVIHQTNFSAFDLDVYPPLTAQRSDLASNTTELAISQKREDNTSSVQCIRFTSP
ncbi:hypothetical protein CYMTET_31824 [Cymbomonas tetramitiformis]|uniref:VCBS repeat-containing protein n=1 Tax=Cymbomonas tetramitiformis TaxID=36881 RepID=A0AAE0FG84_9CHLO|nr:hypothetical protein CYMTET_31824 [Cymbomonas tetramitiformis]